MKCYKIYMIQKVDSLVLIHCNFDYIANRTEGMPQSTNKNRLIKILNVANEVLKFNEQVRWGNRLEILTPNQMLCRLPTSLAQLKQ